MGIIKIIGALLVFVGGCGCGLSAAAAKKRRICVLRELEQALVLLYGEVEYAAADMVEILDRLSGKTQYFSAFFGGVSRQLCQKCGQPLYQVWQEELELSHVRLYLDEEDRKLWRQIGLHLGGLDRQTQLRTLELIQEQIQKRVSEAELEYHSQAKVYRVLGVTCGLFATILLL